VQEVGRKFMAAEVDEFNAKHVGSKVAVLVKARV
jgi:hypothetical protein